MAIDVDISSSHNDSQVFSLLMNVQCLKVHVMECCPWLAVLIKSEANRRCCQGGCLNALLPFSPFQPSSPTLSLLNPDGSPVLGHCLQASACQRSLCSPLTVTPACALKLSPPCTAASAVGYLPCRSPNWPTETV